VDASSPHCVLYVNSVINLGPIFRKLMSATAEGRDGKELAQELLRNASSYGLNVARIYAHTADDEHPFLVMLPSRHSER